MDEFSDIEKQLERLSGVLDEQRRALATSLVEIHSCLLSGQVTWAIEEIDRVKKALGCLECGAHEGLKRDGDAYYCPEHWGIEGLAESQQTDEADDG